MNTVASIKRGLLLLGSFILAYTLAQYFHEICHSTAAYLSGGNFGKIIIHPFSWSYSYSTSPHRILHTAAGPLGASLIGLIIFILSYRWTKPLLLPILLIAPVIFLENGGYLLIDTIMRSGGDACSLINYGIPTIVIIAIAVLLLVAGVISVILLVKKTGLLAGKFKDRLITLTVGIVTYILVALSWHFFYNRSEIMLWITYAVFESVIVLVIAVIPVKSPSKGLKTISWKTVFIIDLLGIILIVFLLTYPQGKKPSSVKMYSEQPDDFPKVLALPPYANAPFFTNFLYQKGYRYLLSYSFPESTPTNEIYSFLMETHKQNGYTLLKHSVLVQRELDKSVSQLRDFSCSRQI